MIADRIPAATVAVAVSAGAVDVAVAAVQGPVAAICLPRNMRPRKGRTTRGVMTVAMSRVRKIRIVALNLADSTRAVQRSAASIIAAPKHLARAALLQQRRILTPPKSRSCSPVNRSRNIAASPSRLPAPR
jgi:hypothetical protein